MIGKRTLQPEGSHGAIGQRGFGRRVQCAALGCLLILGLNFIGCSTQEAKSPVVTEIAYEKVPLQEDEMPPGPNRELLVMQCMSCHSPTYITMQPAFPRSVWEATVAKMVNVYGSQIRPYDQKLVVDYLMAIRGAQPETRRR